MRSTDARCALAANPTPALPPSAGDRGGKSSKLAERPWNGGVESTREMAEEEEDDEKDEDSGCDELELAAPNGGESEAPRGKSSGEALDAASGASGMSSSDSCGEFARADGGRGGGEGEEKSRANE